MKFTEWIFPIFLLITFVAHWGVKGRELRLWILLFASAIFYGWWDVRLLALIGLVIVISWIVGLVVGDNTRKSEERDRWMAIGVASNLFILGVFKYFNFFYQSFIDASAMVGFAPSWPIINIILPVGVSFYIFQAISYIVDVRRNQLPREERLSRVALYIAFFPQLVAGPIVRAASFMPQMDADRFLSPKKIMAGFRAFLIGWVYKAGLADNIAFVVDPVYADVGAYSNLAVFGATLAFGAQIYFDFAGYSLMAIGVARWFDFFIPKNFDFPYFAADISDFWRRWHISLSSWLRDYLYIPLGGNRLGPWMTYRNLFLTMLLGGLWHGAAWTFVIWGAIHGLALCIHRYFFKSRALAEGWVGVVLGVLATQAIVFFAWVPFRAESLGDTLTIWSGLTGLREGGALQLAWWAWLAPVAIVVDHLMGKSGFGVRIQRLSFMKSPEVYYISLGVLIGLLLALYPLTPAPFIYFQF